MSSADSPKTVHGVLTAAAAFLAAAGVEEPRRSCDLLMARLLGCKPLQLCFRFDEPLAPQRLAAMRRGVKRLAAHEPVQYILGEWEFLGHPIKVDARALIPRPETEGLVQQALEEDAIWNGGETLVVDLGTGSGCIAASVALAKPAARVVALDVSAAALALAEENARALGVAERIAFSDRDIGDVLEPGQAGVLIANLPYVPTAEYEKLPLHIRDYEPRQALDGGDDGLRVIRDAVADAAVVLADGGRIFLEIDRRQADAVRDLLSQAGFGDVTVTQDLGGRDRVVRAVMKGEDEWQEAGKNSSLS